MMPRVRRIHQCGSGHLLCEVCHVTMASAGRVTCPTCQGDIVGRAIGMEQYLHSVFMS